MRNPGTCSVPKELFITDNLLSILNQCSKTVESWLENLVAHFTNAFEVLPSLASIETFKPMVWYDDVL